MNHPVLPLVMLDIEGTSLTAEDREVLRHPATGGVIIFARNIEFKAQLCGLLSSIREVNPDLLIAVDQEGGRVQRLQDGVVRLPAMRRIGECFTGDQAQVASYCLGRLMASEMLAIGFDISFAPVLDIDHGHSEIIGDRSFGRTADEVITLASAFIKGMNEAGMAATGKHFPGHGHVVADSHLALPVDERSKADIFAADIRPFAELSHLLAGVMPAHVVYRQVDDKPAGFSSVWLQGILRQQLQFKGVIFSDDLSMEGAKSVGSTAAATHAALDAGCDMVLVCNDRAAALEALEAARQWCQAAPRQRVAAKTLQASAGKFMLPHEYYEAEAFARQLLEV